MGAGSIALWTIIPLGWLWLGALLSDNAATIYVVALLGCPITMVLWGWGLYRINGVYLRLSGWSPAVAGTSSQVSARARRPVMLLDVLVIASALLALGAFLVWFFVFSGSPTSTPWPDELSGVGN
jgi:hypothetical protein